MFYGDGREERAAAMHIEIAGRRPEVAARRKAYWERRQKATDEGKALGKSAMIDALIERNPAYIRDLLETEDDRFGEGALAARYGVVFMEKAPRVRVYCSNCGLGGAGPNPPYNCHNCGAEMVAHDGSGS